MEKIFSRFLRRSHCFARPAPQLAAICIFALFFFFSPTLSAQQRCTADAVALRNAGRLRNPVSCPRNKRYTEASPRSSVTIQVVVHIVYKSPLENISDSQIHSQLAVLNEDYRKLNANAGAAPPLFAPLAADMELAFCLAGQDPQGNPGSGITRRETPWNNIGQLIAPDGRPRIHYADLGGTDAWDPERYLNIWVCSIGGGILGFGAYPGTAPPAEDGVVVDPRYFGTTGLAVFYPPHDKGRTATHEIGHYFNLLHIWGPDENSCIDDDEVADTPTQRAPYLGCPAYPQFSCGNSAMFMNFMDYTDDACMALFTEGQKSRLWATLNTVRSGLTNSVFCTATPAINIIPAQHSMRVFPVPASAGITVESPLLEEEYRIEIRDMAGRLWEAEMGAGLWGGRRLDVSGLPAGVFHLTLLAESGAASVRFVKMY